jgi:hypothetical protein
MNDLGCGYEHIKQAIEFARTSKISITHATFAKHQFTLDQLQIQLMDTEHPVQKVTIQCCGAGSTGEGVMA